ncbi:hypothetical protein [Parafrankia sp. BMG5.11]|uniref:hypothetical protein n=1 Tax=Parafrankia sp. BMG5.11 TaxID=222540 RepID=UPI00103FF67A|nr:hypothetical protein [Parafrankia sp. BMG5.11]MBL8655753.1 hypothetical protein [Altererythrobacter sp.]TCJ40861.1 hypothetical protein E0504_02785 [Parafrankia sp. BMG5.11]
MLRRLHLILAALAMLVAPLAMQSGMAMAAMPMDHREMAKSGHCGDEDSGSEDQPGAMTQCCVAMCSAVAPLGAASLELVMYHAPLLFGLPSTEHRAFLAKLPTPPPKLA